MVPPAVTLRLPVILDAPSVNALALVTLTLLALPTANVVNALFAELRVMLLPEKVATPDTVMPPDCVIFPLLLTFKLPTVWFTPAIFNVPLLVRLTSPLPLLVALIDETVLALFNVVPPVDCVVNKLLDTRSSRFLNRAGTV